MIILIREYIKFFIRVILWFFLHVFYLCPIDKKKIYFRAFHGKRYGCSPKYFFLFLLEKYGASYRYIWELADNKRELSGAECVKRLSLKSFIHMMTSRYIITNNDFMWWIPLRKEQIVVETWHGGGAYKRIGKHEKGLPLFHTEQVWNAKQISYYVSSCQKYTEALSDSKYVSPDKFIPAGLPRNEIFFFPDRMAKLKQKVFEQFGLPTQSYTHIVLFAPTYRGIMGYKKDNEEVCLEPDYDKLLSSLKEKFGGSWVLFYRSHYFDSNLLKSLPDKVIDATRYEDMQELLCASDVLVTDFSSSMWDFALTGKPCFLYAPDIQQYIDQRGFYTDPFSWPFPMAQSDDELTNNILDFDQAAYEKALEKHYSDFGSYENKDACQKVCEAIGINDAR